MNEIDLKEAGKILRENYDQPTPLFQDAGYRIYWLGVPEASAFRSNTYLIVDNEEAVLVDPGGVGHFDFIRKRVAQILPPERVIAQVLSHQDPDVAASFPFWVDVNPAVKVITSIRVHTQLSHYRDVRFESQNIEDQPEFRFISGKSIRFIPSPFLHSPGAFVTFDPVSGFLFSGDIWAAVDMEWRLVIDDFTNHELKLNLFHIDYMASNKAARGFIQRIKPLGIRAILPQHGSIIPEEFIPPAFQYLFRLNCGTDILYPDL